MKEIKTIQDIQNVPADELIKTVEAKYNRRNYDYDPYCPFCGKALLYSEEGVGKEQYKHVMPCSCQLGQAAYEHNKLAAPDNENQWMN